MTQQYKKKQIQAIHDIETDSNGTIHYQLSLKNKSSLMWVPYSSITPQTRTSGFFSDLIQQCPNKPVGIESHRELSNYVRKMQDKVAPFNWKVVIDKHRPTIFMYLKYYYWPGIQGHVVTDLCKDIIEECIKFEFLPTASQYKVTSINQVLFFIVRCVYICGFA